MRDRFGLFLVCAGHVSNHVGQIVYLCRLVQKDGWDWITVPPGESATARKYLP